MQESHKKQFWTLVNVAMELTNHPPLSKEAIVVWWQMLSKYEYVQVEQAIDEWCKSSNKPPTPSDILKLCQPKSEFYKAIGYIPDAEIKKEGLKEIDNFIAANTKPKTDYKAWAKRILANPSKFPDKSVIYAKEALNFN
jgi:hypothetical protein